MKGFIVNLIIACSLLSAMIQAMDLPHGFECTDSALFRVHSISTNPSHPIRERNYKIIIKGILNDPIHGAAIQGDMQYKGFTVSFYNDLINSPQFSIAGPLDLELEYPIAKYALPGTYTVDFIVASFDGRLLTRIKANINVAFFSTLW